MSDNKLTSIPRLWYGELYPHLGHSFFFYSHFLPTRVSYANHYNLAVFADTADWGDWGWQDNVVFVFFCVTETLIICYISHFCSEDVHSTSFWNCECMDVTKCNVFTSAGLSLTVEWKNPQPWLISTPVLCNGSSCSHQWLHKAARYCHIVDNSSIWHDDVIKGNIFCVTGHLCGKFTGHRWIPRTKASDAERWPFLWSALE